MQKTPRQFYASLGLLIILNLVIKPIWIFAIDRHVQNVVGTVEYGSYFSLVNLSIVFSFLLDWGFTSFYNRQLAAKEESMKNVAGYFLLVKFLFSLFYVLIVLLVAFSSGIDRWDIMIPVILIQVFTSFFLFFRAIITAGQWFKTDAVLSVLDKSLMILTCGIFLFFPAVAGGMNINKFLWTQTGCLAFSVLATVLILVKQEIKFSFSGSFSFLKIFRSAFPYALIVLLMGIHFRLDGFLLERIHPAGAEQAGNYVAAYRLLDAANMIGYLFASFLLPYIAKQWSEKKDITYVILTTRHVVIAFSVGVSALAIFMAPWIQSFLYSGNTNTTTVIQYCIPALIGYSLVAIYGTVLTATGHIRHFCTITFIAVLINTVLNLLLIPSWGAKGCCIAALISQGFCGVATLLAAKNKLDITIDYRSLLIYTMMAALISGLFYYGNQSGFNIVLLIAAAVILTFLSLLFTKLLKPAEWLSFLNKSNL